MANIVVTPQGHGLGLIRGKYDPRDRHFQSRRGPTLPPIFDLRSVDAPICDQLQLGGCVGNGVGEGMQFGELKEALSFQGLPSRLAIYYGARAMEGNADQDAGCEIRDAIKYVAQQGVVPEIDWPYDITKFAVAPPITGYPMLKAIEYLAVDIQRAAIKSCIFAGYPLIFGIDLYQAFESQQVATTGLVPMPTPNQTPIGGHCMRIVGWDDGKVRADCHNRGVYIVANSWGKDWGALRFADSPVDGRGYAYIPYDYVEGPDASDFWTIRLVK